MTSLSAKLSQLGGNFNSSTNFLLWPAGVVNLAAIDPCNAQITLSALQSPLNWTAQITLNWYYWETDVTAPTGGERSYLPQALWLKQKQLSMHPSPSFPVFLLPKMLFPFLMFLFFPILCLYSVFLTLLYLLITSFIFSPSLIEGGQYLVERTDLTWNTLQSKPNAWTRWELRAKLLHYP